LTNRHLGDLAIHALEKNVEENSHRTEWPVYDHYEIFLDKAGKNYLRAREAINGTVNPVKKRLRPLSRVSADLFLRFAHWVENPGMDEELDTERNARAAQMWVNDYGVLGLNDPDITIIGLLNSQRVTADYLEMPWRGGVARGRRNTAHGGRPHESVENFAFEAWEAHIVWRLYELVRSREVIDVPSVSRFMSPFEQGEPGLTRHSWVERDSFSSDPELARSWALTIVDDAVNRKIENYCYPIVQGIPGSYEPSWGFRSLLGAMWLQMMFLMREDRRCWWCGKPLDPGMPSHARFCKDNNGRCRANWNYNEGSGKSSKESRRQSRYTR
jgi:hypothetical protein